jgi:hypothetical protein
VCFQVKGCVRKTLQGLASLGHYSSTPLMTSSFQIARAFGPALHHRPEISLLISHSSCLQFVCFYVNGGVQTTPDGLAFIRQFSPTQYSNNAAFLAIVYSDYLAEAGASLTCGSTTYSPAQVTQLFKCFALHWFVILIGSPGVECSARAYWDDPVERGEKADCFDARAAELPASLRQLFVSALKDGF